MAKDLLFREDARKKLEAWASTQSLMQLKITLGPKGPQRYFREILWFANHYQRRVSPLLGRLTWEDPFENLGLPNWLKKWQLRPNDVAGDGTTTATVLAQAIVRGGL